MAWSFTTDNAATVKRWSVQDTRDSEKTIWWAPLFFADGKMGEKAQKQGMKPESKWKGIVRVFTEFESQSGDRLTVPHVPKVTGPGVHGDALLRGSGAVANLTTQDIFLDIFAKQVQSKGPLSEQRAVLKFLDSMRPEMSKWYAREIEEALVLSMWGLTEWYGSIFENYTSGQTGGYIWNNAIETFDSGAISYAGDATSDNDIDSGNVLSAQFLDKLWTTIREDRTYPVEPLMDENGEPCCLFVTSGRGMEQLRADEQFRDSFTRVVPNADNVLTKRAKVKFGNFYIAEYEKCPRVSQNVQRSMVFGADSHFLLKYQGQKYFVNDADDGDRRKALSVSGGGGAKANKVKSDPDGSAYRRNMHAVDHYVRT